MSSSTILPSASFTRSNRTHLWGKGKVMNGKQNSRMSYWPISTGVPPHFFFQQKCLQLPDTFPRRNISYVEYVRKSVMSISEMNGYGIFNKFLTYFWYKWMSIRKFISKIGIGRWFTQPISNSDYLHAFLKKAFLYTCTSI